MTGVRLRVIAAAGPILNGSGDPGGRYVKSYDPDGHDGYGDVTLTLDSAQAHVYPDGAAALEAWRAQSTVRPLRSDGLPNRPLTAFTVETEPVEDPT
jgi:hypothetical protein